MANPCAWPCPRRQCFRYAHPLKTHYVVILVSWNGGCRSATPSPVQQKTNQLLTSLLFVNNEWLISRHINVSAAADNVDEDVF